MAILVAGPEDSAPAEPGSLLEDAFVVLVADLEPVWERVAVQLEGEGLVHREFGPARARWYRGDCALGPQGEHLVGRVRDAVAAERRAYAEGLVATAELAALVEANPPWQDQAARREPVQGPQKRPVVTAEYVAQVLAFELGISTTAAMDRLGRAWGLAGLPRTLAALQGGWLGVGAANALLRATAGVDAGALDAVEARVFDALGRRRVGNDEPPLGSWPLDRLRGLAVRSPRLAADLDSTSTPGWVRAGSGLAPGLRSRPTTRPRCAGRSRRPARDARCGSGTPTSPAWPGWRCAAPRPRSPPATPASTSWRTTGTGRRRPRSWSTPSPASCPRWPTPAPTCSSTRSSAPAPTAPPAHRSTSRSTCSPATSRTKGSRLQRPMTDRTSGRRSG